MRKKIQSSMILVISLTLIIAYAITTLVVYRQTIQVHSCSIWWRHKNEIYHTFPT